MLPATEEEKQYVRDYMEGRAPDLTVTFIQKVYEENIISQIHAVWDVHTNKDRWWVMTNPMNLYSQEQFPNMDYAVTFHVGLCIRIPRSEKQKATDLPVEPFAGVYKEGVPDKCPQCGSQNLSPERGTNTTTPRRFFERPTCDDCDWVGEPMKSKKIARKNESNPKASALSQMCRSGN